MVWPFGIVTAFEILQMDGNMKRLAKDCAKRKVIEHVTNEDSKKKNTEEKREANYVE